MNAILLGLIKAWSGSLTMVIWTRKKRLEHYDHQEKYSK